MPRSNRPYPPEFIARAKALYPEDRGIHELLDAGDMALGQWIEVRNPQLFVFDVLLYIDGGTVAELREVTQREWDKAQLFMEWCELRPRG